MALALALLAVLAVGAGVVWLARELRSSQAAIGATLGDLQHGDRTPARGARRRGRPPPRRARPDARPPARPARHQGRPPPRERAEDDDGDPRAPRQGRQRRRADARAREGPLAPGAGAPPPEGTRRLRRAAAREPPPRPAARDGVPHAVRLLDRRARRRGGARRRTADPRRLEVPARQLPARRRGGLRRRAPARREGVRARRALARRCDRGEVRAARRGHVRFRVHVHPGRGGVLRDRLRPDVDDPRVRARAPRVPDVAVDVRRVPPGDRVRAARACRSSSTRTR